MKKKIIVTLLAALIVFSMLALNSCMFLDGSELLNNAGNSNSASGGSQAGNENSGDSNITVNAGDNYDITINSGAQPNVLAAAKSVLSVVSVYSNFNKDQYSWSGTVVGTTKATKSGSGVIYKLDKETGTAYIITNYHVVYDAYCNTKNNISNDITLYLYGQEATKYAIPATYVGGSMNYDIAVLKVVGSDIIMQSHATAATVADSDKISILETAIAIGNPEGIGLSATVGVVSVDSENIKINMIYNNTSREVELRCIRIDAAVNSGNSGGGLFNDKGELTGIVNAKLSDESVDNIGYAIPSNVATAIAQNIIDYCDGTDKENVYRCLLGVTVGATQSYLEYDKETGEIYKKEKVVITEISDTGAAKGILKEYDTINTITIDGKTHQVTRIYHVVDSMLNARVGSTVIINLTRGEETIDVTIPITEEMLTAY